MMGSQTDPKSNRRWIHLSIALVAAFALGVLSTYIVMNIFGLIGSKDEKTPGDTRKSASEVEDFPISDMLLPIFVTPEHYDLRLKAYLPGYGAEISAEKNLTFDAKLTITFIVDTMTQVITLNEKDLSFSDGESKLEIEDKKEIKVVKIVKNESLDKVEFHLEKPVSSGKVKLHIEYSGAISDKLSGLYQTKYTSADGRERIAAVTQMEATDARRMVPCFDEPLHKAVWKVTLVHPKGTSALSNGIELGNPEPEDDGFLKTEFKETPKMSSYLLAVIISEFTYIEKKAKSGVRFRIWTRPEAKKTAEFALNAGVKCLEGYEEFFGIPYPLDKQDMVAIPDFAAGAMENWGLITYRENALLYDESNYYFTNKARVAQVIAHELAHQWFGNLVTMKWWDDIWLNEGFAAFVQNIGTDIIFDSALQMETDFVSEQHRKTLELDGTAASHPIFYTISYQHEISPLFDAISYRKGASLISMIRQIMGKESFNQGIKNYLRRYSYKNAEHLDLFSEWDQVVPDSVNGPQGTRLNVTDFALKWTRQMGYPFLSLERMNSTAARVVQQRYKVDPEAKERERFASPPYGYKWDVPVWIQREGMKDVELKWLASDGDLVINAREDEAVVLNADSYAIARMNYDEDGWKNVFRELEKDPKMYSERTKYRIVSDVFAMADIGKVNYSLPFELTKYISQERVYLVWEAFLDKIREIRDYFGTSPSKFVIDEFLDALVTPVSRNLGLDSPISKMLNEFLYMENRLAVLLFKERCSFDEEAKVVLRDYSGFFFNKSCTGEAISSKCSRVSSALRTNVYCEAVRSGNDEVFEKMLGFYKRETLQLERDRLLESLTCTRDPVRIKWLLGNILDRKTGLFRQQDLGTVAQLVARNPIGSEIVLGYLFSNWDALFKNFGDGSFIFGRILTAFTSQIRDRYSLKQLSNFLETTPETEKFYVLTQQKQAAEKRIQWLEKNGETLIRILEAQLNKSQGS